MNQEMQKHAISVYMEAFRQIETAIMREQAGAPEPWVIGTVKYYIKSLLSSDLLLRSADIESLPLEQHIMKEIIFRLDRYKFSDNTIQALKEYIHFHYPSISDLV